MSLTIFTKEEVNRILAQLTPREEVIIRLRYGIGEPRAQAYQEITENFSGAKRIFGKPPYSRSWAYAIIKNINREKLPKAMKQAFAWNN